MQYYAWGRGDVSSGFQATCTVRTLCARVAVNPCSLQLVSLALPRALPQQGCVRAASFEWRSVCISLFPRVGVTLCWQSVAQPTESDLSAIRKVCLSLTRQLKKADVDLADLLKLLNLLKRFPSNKEVVGLGMSVLVSVDDLEEGYTQRLFAHGLMEFVLHAMAAIPEDASIQDGCCGLLSTMLLQGSPAYEREQLQARTGVMNLLLAVLAKPGRSDMALHKAMTALSNMLPQSPKLKQEFVTAGGVSIAKAAAEAKQRSEPVVIGFAWVIKNLTAGYEPSARAVLTAGMCEQSTT